MNARQQSILQVVIDKGRMSVADLAKMTGVSEVTIRQDLNLLEKQSYLRRTHGYAVPLDSEDVETRMMTHFAIKRELASRAAALVNAGETVFIENGSSNALLARTTAERGDITIITVSSYIAHLLKETPGEVILLGGIYQKRSESMVGPLTRQFIQQVHFSKAFIGIDGWQAETGFTGRDMMRADGLTPFWRSTAKRLSSATAQNSARCTPIRLAQPAALIALSPTIVCRTTAVSSCCAAA